MVLMDHLLLSTTGGHYPITGCIQFAASTAREGKRNGAIHLTSVLEWRC